MSKAFTGPKCSLKINGTKVAYASGFQVTHENTLADIDVLDELETAEHAEVGHKVNFSVNKFKIDDNNASDFGLDPDNIDEILSQPEAAFEVYNRIGDKVEYEVLGVKFEGGSGSVDARGVWQGVWNFRGRRGKGI